MLLRPRADLLRKQPRVMPPNGPVEPHTAIRRRQTGRTSADRSEPPPDIAKDHELMARCASP
jgi:hypothetical protein